MDGLVQFFGGIGHIVRLGHGYEGEAFKFGYLVDPLRNSEPAETREPTFDIDLLPQFDDGHAEPGPEVWPVYREIYETFLSKYMRRAVDMEIARIIEEVINSTAPDASPEKIVRELSQKLALLTLSSIDKE